MNHRATDTAAIQPYSSSSIHYEQPLTEKPYPDCALIDPYKRIITDETESSHHYDSPLN